MGHRRVIGCIVSSLVACGGGGGQGDRPDGPPSLADRCAAVDGAFEQLVAAADHTCADASDCAVVGAIATCSCAAFLGARCEGDPISVAGRTAIAAQLGAYQAEWDQLGCWSAPEVPRTCDCGPAIVDCVGDRCVMASAVSCFVDAGVTDAP